MADEEKVLPVKKALEENYSENLSDQDAINNLEEEEVKDVFDQIEALLRNEDPTAVHKFRDAGLLVNTIFDKKTDKEARRIVNEMARTKYLNAKVLYAARKFALEFTPAQVEYVAELYNPERRLRVDQTHLQYVMMDYISSTEERIKYLERAVREGMKPLTMYAIIKEDYERVPTGGAKHKVPNSPEALLLEINESCTKILRKMEQVWLDHQNGAAQILNVPSDEINEITRSELLDAIEVCEKMEKYAGTLRGILESMDPIYLDAILKNPLPSENGPVAPRKAWRKDPETVTNAAGG